jgi:hypothetical protein
MHLKPLELELHSVILLIGYFISNLEIHSAWNFLFLKSKHFCHVTFWYIRLPNLKICTIAIFLTYRIHFFPILHEHSLFLLAKDNYSRAYATYAFHKIISHNYFIFFSTEKLHLCHKRGIEKQKLESRTFFPPSFHIASCC